MRPHHLQGFIHLRHVRQEFPCRPTFTCRDVMLHAKANASIDLTGGITCRLLHAQAEGGKQHQRQGDHGYRRCGTIPLPPEPSSSRAAAPKAALANASRGNIEAEGLQAMDATASVTVEGTVSCHATRKIEGGSERHGQHIIQGTSAHHLQDTFGKRPH